MSSNAAMSIMDKYQSLSRGIEEARQETQKYQEETEAHQTEINQLLEDRSAMMKDTEEARHQFEDLKSQVQETFAETDSTHDSSMERNVQQRRVNFLRQYMAQQQRDFCEASRQFRSSVKRLKFTSTECGLDTAAKGHPQCQED